MSSSYNCRNFVLAFSRLALLMAMATLLASCFGAKTTGSSQPSEPKEFALTVIARTASGAPEDFGVQPGDLAVEANVSVKSMDFPDATVVAGITDETGRVVLMMKSGKYDVIVKLDTHDPLCHWTGKADVEVTNRNTDLSIDDLWVICE